MKKIFLIFALIIFACDMQAQVAVIRDGRIYGCPKEFTKDKTGVVYSITTNGVVKFYDADFNVVKTFTCKNGKRPADIVEDCIIDGKDSGCKDASLTQTFFNNDEKWEYVVSVDGIGSSGRWEESYFVYNEDGECLGKLPQSPEYLIVIEGKKYMVLEEDDTYFVYNMENGMEAFGGKTPDNVTTDSPLVGEWESAEITDEDGHEVIVTFKFNADGTFVQTLSLGNVAQTGRWVDNGDGTLTLTYYFEEYETETITLSYSVSGDKGTIIDGDLIIPFTRK